MVKYVESIRLLHIKGNTILENYSVFWIIWELLHSSFSETGFEKIRFFQGGTANLFSCTMFSQNLAVFKKKIIIFL